MCTHTYIHTYTHPLPPSHTHKHTHPLSPPPHTHSLPFPRHTNTHFRYLDCSSKGNLFKAVENGLLSPHIPLLVERGLGPLLDATAAPNTALISSSMPTDRYDVMLCDVIVKVPLYCGVSFITHLQTRLIFIQ